MNVLFTITISSDKKTATVKQIIPNVILDECSSIVVKHTATKSNKNMYYNRLFTKNEDGRIQIIEVEVHNTRETYTTVRYLSHFPAANTVVIYED